MEISSVSTTPTLSLPYLLRKPIEESERPPLLLMFHGYGSNEEDPFGLARNIPPEFLVLSIRAPLTLLPGQYAWFDLDWSSGLPTSEPQDAEVARLFMKTLIDEVAEVFDIDVRKIYLLGFSQGAVLSLSVALTFPGLIRGVVLLSGKITSETKTLVLPTKELRELPIFMGHGSDDPVIPISSAYEMKEYLEMLGVKLVFREYAMGHTVSQQEERDVSEWLTETFHS